MNQQPTIIELIETVSQSLEADGITAEYIQQLSYTWNALKDIFPSTIFSLVRKAVSCFWKKFPWHIFSKRKC